MLFLPTVALSAALTSPLQTVNPRFIFSPRTWWRKGCIISSQASFPTATAITCRLTSSHREKRRCRESKLSANILMPNRGWNGMTVLGSKPSRVNAFSMYERHKSERARITSKENQMTESHPLTLGNVFSPTPPSNDSLHASRGSVFLKMLY